MARIRTIKPEFPQDEKVGTLSRDARLLFIQLWTIVDDAGRVRAASLSLAGSLFPYDEDARVLIEGWLQDLESGGFIRRYKVNGNSYLDIPKWLNHQKIDRPSPSKFPSFEEADAPLIAEPSRSVASPRDHSMLEYGSKTLDLGPRTREQIQAATDGSGGTTHAHVGAGVPAHVGAHTREGRPPADAGPPPAPETSAWTDNAPLGRDAAAGGAR